MNVQNVPPKRADAVAYVISAVRAIESWAKKRDGWRPDWAATRAGVVEKVDEMRVALEFRHGPAAVAEVRRLIGARVG